MEHFNVFNLDLTAFVIPFLLGLAYAVVGMVLCAWVDNRWRDCIERAYGENALVIMFVLAVWPLSILFALLNHRLYKSWWRRA